MIFVGNSGCDTDVTYASWQEPSSPPLPYLWVYLVLQVVLQKEPELHSTIYLCPSIDGPI